MKLVYSGRWLRGSTVIKEEKSISINKLMKDRLALLLYANFGDLKIKALLVYHSENSLCLRKIMI